jgi:hypothetical protein
MGMRAAFTDTGADFSRASDTPLMVTDVKQRWVTAGAVSTCSVCGVTDSRQPVPGCCHVIRLSARQQLVLLCWLLNT